MFENPQVAVAGLPSADDVDWHTLDLRFALVLRIRTGLVLAGLATGLVVLTILVGPPAPVSIVAWLALAASAAWLLVWPGISVRRRGYALRARDILFRKGVLWRSVTAVPFNRIQHVETSSTPLDRRFGLATLQLFTAGGSGADLKIDGLEHDLAERIRQDILEKTGATVEHD